MLWSLFLSSAFLTILEVEKVRGVPYQISENLEADFERYSLRVDERIELLSAVQLFTSWAGIWQESYPYKEDMLNFFNSFSSHKAVTLCEKLIQVGFSYGAPVSFMLCLSDPPELNVTIPFSEWHIDRASRAGGKAVLEEFVEALRSFYIQSNFEKFWDSHQEFYHNVEEHANASIPLESTVKTLEDYFGIKQHGYHVILAPLFWGNYAPRIKVNDSLDIYAVLCPMRIEGNIPVFGAALFHEFAHSFVNPLTDEFLEEYKNPERLFKPIARRMEAMAYGTWPAMINEHIVRAVDIKVFNEMEQLSHERARGFIYIEPLFDLLSEYDRDSYESFREFYPEIVDLFNDIAARPTTPFIETPLGIATISSGIIAIIIATVFIARARARTALIVLEALIGIASVIIGFCCLLLLFFGTSTPGLEPYPSLFRAVVTVFMSLYLTTAFFSFAIVYRIRKDKDWYWTLGLVLAVIYIVLGIFLLPAVVGILFLLVVTNILLTLLSTAIIYYLMRTKKSFKK